MNNNIEAEMFQILSQNQNNPHVFQELIIEFAEYYRNTTDIIDDKIKQADDNWKPSGVTAA